MVITPAICAEMAPALARAGVQATIRGAEPSRAEPSRAEPSRTGTGSPRGRLGAPTPPSPPRIRPPPAVISPMVADRRGTAARPSRPA